MNIKLIEVEAAFTALAFCLFVMAVFSFYANNLNWMGIFGCIAVFSLCCAKALEIIDRMQE